MAGMCCVFHNGVYSAKPVALLSRALHARGCRVDDDIDAQEARVRADHYLHWLAVITAGVWAGSIYGWLTGVGVLVGVLVAITLTNNIIIAKTGSLRAVRANRWAWVIFAILTIVVLSGEVHTIQP